MCSKSISLLATPMQFCFTKTAEKKSIMGRAGGKCEVNVVWTFSNYNTAPSYGWVQVSSPLTPFPFPTHQIL
jgi:hypothetical protein